MAQKSVAQRVLVHLKTSSSSSIAGMNPLRPGSFSECLLESLSPGCVDRQINVKCYLEDNRVILENAESSDPCSSKLKHLDVCPMKMMNQSDKDGLPQDIISRGINVGVVTLLESSDQYVLITRRAPHMRTFPGVWVPPGGGIDWDETLIGAGIRELLEETGLSIESEIKRSQVLCLWESVYPPMLTLGEPKRHHLVIYHYIQVASSKSELSKRVQLDPNEVDACAWLNERQIDVVVNGFQGEEPPSDLPKTFELTVIEDGIQMSQECPVGVLTAKAPKNGMDVERISSGTRYALEQWLLLFTKTMSKI